MPLILPPSSPGGGAGLSEAEVQALIDAAIAAKAPIANPTFTGNVVVPDADAATEAMNRQASDARYAPIGGPYLKDYARATRTAGDITLNATAVTAVDTGLDLVLSAAAGDLIVYSPNMLLAATAAAKGFDVYTMVAGSPVNPFGAGLSASLATVAGVTAWRASATAAEATIMGGMPRTLVSGDISGGTVTLRLFYAGLNTTGRALFAQASYPLDVWAVNLGPA